MQRAFGLESFTRHLSMPKELMGVFQLAPEMTPLSSEAVLDKITMSAFEGTPLDIVLRDLTQSAADVSAVGDPGKR
ncbi:MAG: hypothetical protein ACJ8DC_09695 [Gemmatimonadales bacterium]